MSSDPLERIGKGIAKGGLEWSSDFIKQLVTKFQENKLKFIRDE